MTQVTVKVGRGENITRQKSDEQTKLEVLFDESPPIKVTGVPLALKNYLAYRRKTEN